MKLDSEFNKAFFAEELTVLNETENAIEHKTVENWWRRTPPERQHEIKRDAFNVAHPSAGDKRRARELMEQTERMGS